jgi:hypothetical protein
LETAAGVRLDEIFGMLPCAQAEALEQPDIWSNYQC